MLQSRHVRDVLQQSLDPARGLGGARAGGAIIDKYAIKDSLIAEEREDGLLLRAGRDKRLSWADTFKEMAREREDWSDLDPTVGDGLGPENRW